MPPDSLCLNLKFVQGGTSPTATPLNLPHKNNTFTNNLQIKKAIN
jgi:hypothetical protein